MVWLKGKTKRPFLLSPYYLILNLIAAVIGCAITGLFFGYYFWDIPWAFKRLYRTSPETFFTVIVVIILTSLLLSILSLLYVGFLRKLFTKDTQ